MSLGGRDEALASLLREKSVVRLGLERLPRSTRAQSMDVLSSQASIAGYAAVLEGARQLDVSLPIVDLAAESGGNCTLCQGKMWTCVLNVYCRRDGAAPPFLIVASDQNC